MSDFSFCIELNGAAPTMKSLQPLFQENLHRYLRIGRINGKNKVLNPNKLWNKNIKVSWHRDNVGSEAIIALHRITKLTA
jgi:hypothetical protein